MRPSGYQVSYETKGKKSTAWQRFRQCALTRDEAQLLADNVAANAKFESRKIQIHPLYKAPPA